MAMEILDPIKWIRDWWNPASPEEQKKVQVNPLASLPTQLPQDKIDTIIKLKGIEALEDRTNKEFEQLEAASNDGKTDHRRIEELSHRLFLLISLIFSRVLHMERMQQAERIEKVHMKNVKNAHHKWGDIAIKVVGAAASIIGAGLGLSHIDTLRQSAFALQNAGQGIGHLSSAHNSHAQWEIKLHDILMRKDQDQEGNNRNHEGQTRGNQWEVLRKMRELMQSGLQWVQMLLGNQ
ncbi:MAG: hypothetical protein KDK65_04495 [Chlamydiia bacterium]|nr:hypothetical protein [Chlamydiia bacterium]